MRACRFALLVSFAALLGASRPAPADSLDDLFPFRFLTRTLPGAVAGRDYRARVLTINSRGPVLFSAAGLPTGLALDGASGEITGRTEEIGTLPLEIRASDGATEIVLVGVLLEVLPGGPGPRPGALVPGDLPAGRNGVPYEAMLQVEGGVGPFAFGATGLPAGLRLDGRTGRIHGTPEFQGTAFVLATVRDDGAEGSCSRVLPLDVYPPGSEFRFTTRALNPFGGYTAYNRLETAGATGPVTFGDSGGYGIGVNPVSGWVGIDFEFGGLGAGSTFFTASDGTDVIRTDLPVHDVPSQYDFHWEFERLPVAFVGVPYGDDVPVRLSTANAPRPLSWWTDDLLPPGLELDRDTGALSGVPSRAGLYRCRFSASFASTPVSSGETAYFSGTLVVLPTGGGDASSMAANYCSPRQRLRQGPAGATI